MRRWYAGKTREERRAWVARRDPVKVREQARKKQAKRRANPTPHQKLQLTAHAEVGRALCAGTLVRQPCEVCGAAKVEGHHEDYSKPLQVEWLCHRHHVERHGKVWGD